MHRFNTKNNYYYCTVLLLLYTHPLANKDNLIVSFQMPNIKIVDQSSLKDQLVFAFTASGVLLSEPCTAFFTLGKNKGTQFFPITRPGRHEWVQRQFSPGTRCLHSIRMTENAFMWLIHSDVLLTGVNVFFEGFERWIHN